MIIIGLTGLPASGKGRATSYIVNKYQASRHGFSDSLRDVVRRLKIEENRDNLQKLSIILRQQFGEDLLAKAMAEDIKHDTHDYVIAEGVRREADIIYLKELKGFHLISIEADIKIRYERLKNRAQNTDDDGKTFEEFLKDHEKETELLIPSLMAKAEFKIDNNGTEEELEKQIDQIINQIQNKK